MKTYTIFSKLALAAAAITIIGAAADAHATKKVYSPYVEKGELELEWRGNYINDDDDAEDGAQKEKLAVGYGLTDFWFTELYAVFEKEGASGADFDFTDVEWANRFALTEPGEYWLDVGLYTAYEASLRGGSADTAEVKLLLAKQIGKFSNYANLIVEKKVGENASGGAEAGLAWSTRYHYQPYFEPGFEYHAGFGELNESEDYRDQKHQLGPVIYGDLPQGFKYDVGYLFGVSDAAPDGELKWILEYEMHF